MKTYSSFVVRYWVIRDQPLGERTVLDVEHVQTGDRLRAASLAEAYEWMEAACHWVKPEKPSYDGEARSLDFEK